MLDSRSDVSAAPQARCGEVCGMKRMMMLVAVVVLTAVPAFAADVDGKWTGTLDTPMGPAMVAFTFKAAGTSLTGTTTTPDGGEIAISDGKIDGDKISFNVSLDFGGMPLMISYA